MRWVQLHRRDARKPRAKSASRPATASLPGALAFALAAGIPFAAGPHAVTPASAEGCDCLDLVLIVDATRSMAGAIENVKAGINDIVEHGRESCGSVQAALLSFRDDVTVDHDLDLDLAGVVNAVNALEAAAGAAEPEASDEALREAVSEQGAICGTSGTFTTAAYRPACCRIAVLITDARPGGCDDLYVDGVDDVNAHARALEASGAGVRIGAVFVPTFGDPHGVITSVMTDHAATSGGVFGVTNEDGSGTSDAILALIDACTSERGTEPCCLPSGTCLEVLAGDCALAGGRVVSDCADCMPTATEPATWGAVKVIYR